MRRILLSGGASGGHLFPGIALGTALEEMGIAEACFLDGGSAMEERILAPTGFQRFPVPRFERRPAVLARIWTNLGELFHDPGFDAVVALGAGPGLLPGLRARQKGIPLFLLEQNRVMGKANRLLLPFCRRAFLSLPLISEGRLLRRRMQLLGCPLRAGAGPTPLPDGGVAKLLVVGGSQGAKSVNAGILAALDHLEQPARVQVTHICGPGNRSGVAAAYRNAGVLAEVHEFLQDPTRALREASLVLCRAGGSTVAEICSVGRGAVLMPYRNHRDRHQEHNAAFLTDAGASILAPESARELAHGLEGLLHDRVRLEEMARASASLGHPQAAKTVAETIATHIGFGRIGSSFDNESLGAPLEGIR